MFSRSLAAVYAYTVNKTFPVALDALEPRQLFAISLTPGVNYSTTLRTAGSHKNFAINLVKGQAIMVAAGDVNSSPTFNPELALFAPNGKSIARSSSANGALVSKSAPVTGTYIVRLLDANNTGTGSAMVTAFFNNGTTITDGDDGGVAQSGRRFAASISPGDLDVWRIDATADSQFLSVVANENSIGSDVGVGVLIVGPDGNGIASGASDTGLSVDVPAAKKGTYYAVVYDYGFNGSGRYGISVGQAPGPQTTEDPDTQTPLSSGVVRNGNLPSGDIDLFQVNVPKGHKISVTATQTGGTTSPQLLLIDPNGNLIKSGSGDTSINVALKKTAVGGVWSILLRNGVPDDGGSYALTYVLT